MTALLEAKGLTVTARLNGQSVPVLRDIDLTVREGQVLGLVGESGAGKSMIGRAISQLLPSGFAVGGGTLAFKGRSLVGLAEPERRALLGRDIAFIPQEPITALNPVLSIGQQFDEHLARLGQAGGAARRQRAAAMLEAVHLPDPLGLLGRYPHQLSGGMCQRVLIAMAFAGDPALLIADEPTTALDVTIQARIMRIIREMQAAHRTAVILITHDLKLAARMCDEIRVLYAGSVVEAGPAAKVFADPAHPYTRCLELANPPIEGERRALASLPEHMPGLAALAGMRGCRFAARCPLKAPECETNEPALTSFAPDRLAACLRLAEREAIRPAALAPFRTVIGKGDEPLLKVENLGKRYAWRRSLFGLGAKPVDAVADVSFRVGANEFVGIVGESGSGKSTVAKLVMGLEAPSAGRLTLEGHDVTQDNAATHAKRLATAQMVFQDPQSALNPRRRVGAIVTQAMEAGPIRVSWEDRLTRARVLLAEIGMAPESALRYPSQLSGGQRQRVNIARALCVVPKLLVADEIVSGLDVSVQAQLLNLLLRLKSELGIALLFISHDLSVVRYLCDRVLVMHRGRIVEQGAVDEVFARPRHDYTKALLAAVPPDDLNKPWAAMAEAPRVMEEELTA